MNFYVWHDHVFHPTPMPSNLQRLIGSPSRFRLSRTVSSWSAPLPSRILTGTAFSRIRRLESVGRRAPMNF